MKREISGSAEPQWVHYHAANGSGVLPGQCGCDADQHLTQYLNYLSTTLALQS